MKTTPYGKPFINGKINFNISHSEKCVVCAITDKSRIGVDVEMVKEIDIADFIDHMSDEELMEIQKSKDMKLSFFDYWTKKEAVIKADGRGLSIPLNQISIKNKSAVLSGKKWSIVKVDLGSPFICHLAVDRRDSKIITKKMKMKELFRLLPPI